MRASRILSPGRSCCAKQAGGQCLPWMKGGLIFTPTDQEKNINVLECNPGPCGLVHTASRWATRALEAEGHITAFRSCLRPAETHHSRDPIRTAEDVVTYTKPAVQSPPQLFSSRPDHHYHFPTALSGPETPQKNLTGTCLGR